MTVLLLNRRVSGRTKPPHPSRAIDCVYSGSLRLSASHLWVVVAQPRGFGAGIFTGPSQGAADEFNQNRAHAGERREFI